MAEAKTPKKGAEKAPKSKGVEDVAAAGAVASAPEGYVARLRKHYDEVVRPKMIEEFGYKNPNEVPVIEKIVLNMGVGDAVNDTKVDTVLGMDVIVCTSAKTDDEARALLRAFNFPFRQ